MTDVAGAASPPIFSVIIPTIGRPQVKRALWSALGQMTTDGDPVSLEVIVVDDGTEQAVRCDDERVRVLRTGGQQGASTARNLGMAASLGDFIALLDDDDYWLPTHLAEAHAALRSRPQVSIYSCRALIKLGTDTQVHPTEMQGDRSLMSYLYGPDAWRSRGRRVLTPTLVFRRSLAGLPFDPGLSAWEDYWWLLQAEKSGARSMQSELVNVVVNSSGSRAQERAATHDEMSFARRLDTLEPGAGAHYLVGVMGKAAAHTGRIPEVLRWSRVSRGAGHQTRWHVLGAELIGGAAFAVREVVRRLHSGSRT